MKTETNIEVSGILPCRNEEQSLGDCILKIQEIFKKHNISGEIIVSDSSTDNSPEIAKKFNIKLVKHDKEGYGNAYLEGFKVASGKYLFCADPDGTYDFEEIPRFLKYLRNNYDFVIGDRLTGNIEKGAMPWSHRYIGNPLLSLILRVFFNTKIHDAHCGMRSLKKEVLDKLNLQTTGMEFASEMIVKALRNKIKIKELPINYHQRRGDSKLKSLTDGWRHLRFMLMYAPNYLFVVPGILFFVIGLALLILLRHNVVYGAFLIILGYQIISLGVISRVYMKSIGLIKSDRMIDFLARRLKFESGIILALLFLVAGLVIKIQPVFDFLGHLLRMPGHSIIILAMSVAIVGIQTGFTAFLISILLIEKK